MLSLIPHTLKHIAVAVSGGADSMALLHMLSQQTRVLALTIDHGLRPESAAEAAQVSEQVSKWPNVTHRMLRWDGAKPSKRIQESARDARYALMAEACEEASITHLALAHHRDDQAETFFMRLTRGSGIDGLAAMREFQPYNADLTLWRPLLNDFTHADLVSYCRDNGIAWVEDPSNENEKYTRTRLRAALQSEGLNDTRLNTSLRRIERASDALRVLSARLLERVLREKDEGCIVLDLNLLKAEPLELSVRVLRQVIDMLALENTYGVRFEKVEALTSMCLNAQSTYTATLGGCVLRAHPRKGTLSLTRENAAKAGKSLPLAANGL